MEQGLNSYAGRAGVRTVYGLGNDCVLLRGVAWRGHDGQTRGFLASLRYARDLDAGFIILLNSSSPQAMAKLQVRLATELSGNRPLHTQGAMGAQPTATQLHSFAGYYDKRNPRFEILAFLEALAGVRRFTVEHEKLMRAPIVGTQIAMINLGGGLFRFPDEPVATHAFLRDGDGRAILVTSDYFGIAVPAWICWLRFLAALSCAVVIAGFLAMAPMIVAVLSWRGEFARVWATLPAWVAGAALFALLALLFAVDVDYFGEPTPANITIYWLSTALPLLSAAALLSAISLARGTLSYLHLAAAIASALATAYLLAYNVWAIRFY
jgi:hypothetical protein